MPNSNSTTTPNVVQEEVGDREIAKQTEYRPADHPEEWEKGGD